MAVINFQNFKNVKLFNSEGCKVINPNNQIVATGKLEDGMFKLNQPKSTICLSKSSIKTSTWHMRLGHPCSESMKKTKSMVHGIEEVHIEKYVYVTCFKRRFPD